MDCRHLCQVDAGLPCLVSGTAALAEPAPAVAWWWPSQPASQPSYSSFEVRTDSTVLGSDSCISGTCCFSWWGLGDTLTSWCHSVHFCKGGNHSVFSRGLLWEWRSRFHLWHGCIPLSLKVEQLVTSFSNLPAFCMHVRDMMCWVVILTCFHMVRLPGSPSWSGALSMQCG